MIKVTNSENIAQWQKHVLLFLHILVLAASVLLIVIISYDTFRNIPFLSDPRYIKWQFWICMLFITDVVVEFALSPKKWYYILTHIFFLIISIPYISIIEHFGLHLPDYANYLIRFVPMVRAAYVLSIVSGALTTNKISSMFTAYMALLVVVLYFSSLVFFIEEHTINPDVTTYWSSLWWAFMCMTTAGSYINEYTTIGKVLCVILSGGGLILFPVFTVYITNALTRKNNDDEDSSENSIVSE